MAEDRSRFEAQAANVTIIRDDWGIAHVHGKTDADAVFGMIYAQAEDDFNRIEANYIAALGRAAEVDGEVAIWGDLRQRLFVDPKDLKTRYAASPAYLKALMNAWAGGLNYYLLNHPGSVPKLIRRFQPWMALSFTEGANGGDIAKISLAELAAFHGGKEHPGLAAEETTKARFEEPTGSNGIAIAPAATRDGHALLLINPHTAFFLRSELQMTSDEGLDAYGAVTWGQFFIYQGFNAHAGWMHTTSSAGCVDEFIETISSCGSRLFYRYGDELRPIHKSTVTLRYRTPNGGLAKRAFQVRRTHHGPIVRAVNGKWVAAAIMNRPVEALQQSFGRTKASDLASFIEVSAFGANATNNTVFADDKGEIAFLAPQFVPLRDDRFDYSQPVDGSDPATDWRGVTPLSDLPSISNPPNAWVYNSNDGPWWAAGPYSPRKEAFPRYMDRIGANPRTPHALSVLENRGDFTLESLVAAAHDRHLPALERLLPGLLAAYDALPSTDDRRIQLIDPITILRDWDCCSSNPSVATTLAVSWGEALQATVAPDLRPGRLAVLERIEVASASRKLEALLDGIAGLRRDFGDWRVQWGERNRFQRLDSSIEPRFDDASPSWPVPWASSQWGSLAAFGAKPYPGAKRCYGMTGSSFTAVVEFGPRVRALAVTAGGVNGDPGSPHFTDQAERFVSGDLRRVYFYPDELEGHIERSYRPGDR